MSEVNVTAQLAALRAAGADRFDPVRLHYIEAMARRAMAHHGSARRMLDARLAQVVEAFQESFALAQHDAREFCTRSAALYPHAAKDLQRHIDAGDLQGLRRFVAALKAGEQAASLRALVSRFEQPHGDHATTLLKEQAGPRTELKAIRKFRNTWSRLSVDKQVAQALEQAPKNAGPINSHMLVLRSLALMRDISPDYLNRFISYADALLCLDESEKEKPGNFRKHQAVKAAKK